MKHELADLIKQTTKLPTLPSVATHIVKLANKPDASIAEVTKALSMDPALASKILRFANSAAYGMSRQVESLNRAIVIMGLKAVVNISLSFSLVSALKMQEAEGLNYNLFWRRSLLAAAAARVVGEVCGEKALEELFLAGLLQDIGMLALDRTDKEFYNGLGEAQQDHRRVQSYENALFDRDHTYIGLWLLRRWGLSERTVRAVEHSHDRSPLPGNDKEARFINCVMFSGHVADVYINAEAQGSYAHLASMARGILQLEQKQLMTVLERTGALVKTLEKLFDIKFIEGDSALDVLAAANEALMLPSVESLQKPAKTAKPEAAQGPTLTAEKSRPTKMLRKTSGAMR